MAKFGLIFDFEAPSFKTKQHTWHISDKLWSVDEGRMWCQISV